MRSRHWNSLFRLGRSTINCMQPKRSISLWCSAPCNSAHNPHTWMFSQMPCKSSQNIQCALLPIKTIMDNKIRLSEDTVRIRTSNVCHSATLVNNTFITSKAPQAQSSPTEQMYTSVDFRTKAVGWGVGALRAHVPSPLRTKGLLFESAKSLHGYVHVYQQDYALTL